MSGYPAGAANDPSAPWNQKDDEVCPLCDANNPEPDCSLCNGTGQVSAEDAEEYYEEKRLDEKFERQRDDN